MPAQFIQEGAAIDYTPGADVAAGAVVVTNDLVGLTKSLIKANTTGSLYVTGVYEVPKAAGVGTAIAFGITLYWNAAGQQATATAAGNKPMGKCVRAASDADTTVRVRLSQ